jgi:bifunctional UDP-N-acetylglucosamine pyrophosphorylase/glucosamine-1-phosphate N-acetyltransferase
MVDWIIETGRETGADPIVVVASPATRDEFDEARVDVAIQESPLGTGDAVRAAHAALANHDGDVLVLSGDTPLLTATLLGALVDTHRRERADATILSAEPHDPRLYGRVVRGPDGSVLKVVEGTDANPEEQKIREINSSIYVFRSAALWPALERLEPKNVQGELYLTDAIELVVGSGGRVVAHIASDFRETDGVNTRVELAQAAAVLRDRINEQHMLAGATIVDPQTTWIEPQVELEADSTIHPFTVLRGATRVSTGAEVGPHTVAIDAHIGARAIVGPFCYLRPGTVIGDSS